MADNIQNQLTLKPNQGSTTLFNSSVNYTINLDPNIVNSATNTEGIIKLGNLFAHELGHAQLAGGFISWDQNMGPQIYTTLAMNAEGVAITNEYKVNYEFLQTYANAQMYTGLNKEAQNKIDQAVQGLTLGTDAFDNASIKASIDWASKASPSSAQGLKYPEYYAYQYAIEFVLKTTPLYDSDKIG